jgi:hypothetical protein
MMTALERLESVTGKTFANETPTSLPQKRPSGSTAKETISVD